MNFVQSPSPNSYSRNGYEPELCVIHVTEGVFPGDLTWLRSPESQVSSHLLLAPNGDAHQLVPFALAAWHAGRVSQPTAALLKKNDSGAIVNPNYYTIGIEISTGRPAGTMTAAQENRLHEALRYLNGLFPRIALDRDHIIGHREIFSLKTCPAPVNVDQIVAGLHPPLASREDIKKQIIDLLNTL